MLIHVLCLFLPSLGVPAYFTTTTTTTKDVRRSPYSPLENIGENETLQQPLLPFHSRKRLFQAGFLSYCCSVLSDQATPLILAKVITVFVLF